MAATTAPARTPTHDPSGGKPRRTIQRWGGGLLLGAVVFVAAWAAWNLWLAAYIASR